MRTVQIDFFAELKFRVNSYEAFFFKRVHYVAER
jgi:hypothetical protein